MAPSRSPTFSSAVGMINRIHHNSTDLGAAAQEASPTRFPQGNLSMIQVAHLTHSRAATIQDHTDFARGKLDLHIAFFLGHQLTVSPRGTYDLAALADLHLYVVHHRSKGMFFKGRQFPGVMSTRSPATTESPTFMLWGQIM